MKLAPPAIYRFLGLNTQGDIGPYTAYTAKDQGLVFYLRTSPKKPGSRRQHHQRNKLRLSARAWTTLTQTQRETWSMAGRRAQLRISGYNLYTAAALTKNRRYADSVQHITRLKLPWPANVP